MRPGALLLSLAALTSSGVMASEAVPGRPLQDLHYGQVLFDFYQDDYFTAMAELLSARQVGRTLPHEADGELLLGGMLLAYGQHERAADIFKRRIEIETRPERRNTAWFYLARVSYERGALDEALAALGNIDASAELAPEMDAERRVLAAQIMIQKGQYEQAAQALQQWEGTPDWASYAKFNLGVALLRAGRADEAGVYLEQVGTEAGGNEEQLAIRDRANVALGFSKMQADQPEAARVAFYRVRLDGPSSNKALLGLGWAESALGNDRGALVPWTTLSQRDLSDPAVQESLLALPYALSRLERPSSSARQYEVAVTTYATEVRHLDDAIARIRSGDLIESILVSQDSAELGVNGRMEAPPDSEDSHYLYVLMASDAFQESMRAYRDLLFLKDNLAQWRERLPFADVAFEAYEPQVTEQIERIDHLSGAVDSALGRQAQYLQALAVKALQTQQERLRSYIVEARFALARTYDAAVQSQDAGGTP